MAYIPKFLSKPVQGWGAAANWLWNGRFDAPEWTYGSWTGDKPGSLNSATLKKQLEKQPKVSKEAQKNIATAYKKLGFSYDRAAEDPDYVDKVFQQAREKLASAGAEVPENASIHELAAAYDKLDDAGKKTYSAPKAATRTTGTSAEGTPAGQEQEKAAKLANGKSVPPSGAAGAQAAAASAPLAPRVEPSISTGTRRGTGIANDSRVRVDGAPLTISNTAGQNALARLQNETLATAAIQAAEGRKAAQSDAQTSEVDRLHNRNVQRLRQDQALYSLSQAREQFREQKRADLMEKRYRDRSFRDADDWANLGRLREGEKMLDQGDYDTKIGALVKDAKKLRSAEGRAGLGQADLRAMDMVFKTVGKLSTDKDDKGNIHYENRLTPAQVEALGKRIEGFKSRAKAAQDRAAVQAAAHNSRVAEQYRQQYGLQGFSDEDVLDFHKKRTAKTANEALDRMMKYGATLKNDAGNPDAEAARQYEKDWDTIRGNVDVTSVFNRAMEDQATKDKFMEDSAAIKGNGFASDLQRGLLRRQAILNQMLKERNPETAAPEIRLNINPGAGTTQAAPAPQSNPSPSPVSSGAQAGQPAAQTALPGSGPAPAVQQPAESLVPGLTPKKKKDEDVQAAMFAGVPLRPRSRR